MDVRKDGEYIVIRKDINKPINRPTELEEEINFLSGEQPYNSTNVSLPYAYYEVIREIMRKNLDYKWELPLEFDYSYKDLQNKEYGGTIKLIISPSFCYGYDNEIIDGKNGCVLRLEGEIFERNF